MTSYPKSNQSNHTALITGASSGIGYAFADVLAKKKYNLVLIARRQAILQTLAQRLQDNYAIKVEVIVQDLSVPEAVEKIRQQLEEKQLKIDFFINNAGAGILNAFQNISLPSQTALLQLDVITPTQLLSLLLPHMLSNKFGKILNVSSMAAFQPGPYMANYFAAKSYLLSLSEAIAIELQGTGVTVTALCPGPTSQTEFAQVNNLKSTLIHQGIVPLWTAQQVAEFGYRQMMKGRRVAIPGLINSIAAKISKIIPNGLSMKVLVRLHQKSLKNK